MIISLHPLVLPEWFVYCILYLYAGLTTLRNGRLGNGLCRMYTMTLITSDAMYIDSYPQVTRSQSIFSTLD